MTIRKKAARATDWMMIPIYLGSFIWLLVWIWDNYDEPSAFDIVQEQVDELVEYNDSRSTFTIVPAEKK